MLGYYDRAVCGEAVGLYFFAQISQGKATITGCVRGISVTGMSDIVHRDFTAQSNNKIFSFQDIKGHFMKII